MKRLCDASGPCMGRRGQNLRQVGRRLSPTHLSCHDATPITKEEKLKTCQFSAAASPKANLGRCIWYLSSQISALGSMSEISSRQLSATQRLKARALESDSHGSYVCSDLGKVT